MNDNGIFNHFFLIAQYTINKWCKASVTGIEREMKPACQKREGEMNIPEKDTSVHNASQALTASKKASAQPENLFFRITF